MSTYLSLFNNRTNGEAEAPIFGSSDVKNQLIEKCLMMGKSKGRERREHQKMRWLDGITNQWT